MTTVVALAVPAVVAGANPPQAFGTLVAGTVRFDAVACASATSCWIGGISDNGAALVPWQNGAAGQPTFYRQGNAEINGIACPNPSTCIAVGNLGYSPTQANPFPPPGAGKGFVTIINDGQVQPQQTVSPTLYGISCPDSHNCLAIGSSTVYTGGSSSTVVDQVIPIVDGVLNTPIDIDLAGRGIACGSVNYCLMTDRFSQGSAAGTRTEVLSNLRPGPVVAGVTGGPLACPSTTTCVEAIGTTVYRIVGSSVVTSADLSASPFRDIRSLWCNSSICSVNSFNSLDGLAMVGTFTNPVAGQTSPLSHPVDVSNANTLYATDCTPGSCIAVGLSNGQVGLVATIGPDGTLTSSVPPGVGYWTVARDGGVFSFGTAQFYGSTGNLKLNQPVVGMAATSDDRGYWFVASDGGIFSYGGAAFHGSTGAIPLNQPIVGMAADYATGGYWLVARDGGVFSFGAPFYGSTGNITLNQPIVGMAAAKDGGGYWFMAADGGVFAFNEPFYGAASENRNYKLTWVGIAATPDGKGYWQVASDGRVFPFGDAQYYGDLSNGDLTNMSGISALPGGGYVLSAADGRTWAFTPTVTGNTSVIALNQPIVGASA